MIRERVFSEMLRIRARKSELQAESRSYSRADPQNPNQIARKGPWMGFACFYRKPPLKPSWKKNKKKKNTRVFLFAKPLKRKDSEGKTYKKARKIGKQKKARKSKEKKSKDWRVRVIQKIGVGITNSNGHRKYRWGQYLINSQTI